MNKVQQQMRRAKKAGMTAVDVMRMKEIAKREAVKMETRATEEAFLFMLAIPLNVLFNDYWQKTAKSKAPKFIEDVISLYSSVQEGIVTKEELNDLLYELAGIKVDAEWLKNMKEGGKNENNRRNI